MICIHSLDRNQTRWTLTIGFFQVAEAPSSPVLEGFEKPTLPDALRISPYTIQPPASKGRRRKEYQLLICLRRFGHKRIIDVADFLFYNPLFHRLR
jgi:hypothetical protein